MLHLFGLEFMAMLITTKCPHCHTKFDIPAVQFEDSTAKGRCSQCHKTFFINNHIVNKHIPASKTTAISPTPQSHLDDRAVDHQSPTTKPSSTSKVKVSTTKADADLIYDDMAIEEDDDIGDIGDALIYDDMDINTSKNATSALSELDIDALFNDRDDNEDNRTKPKQSATYDTPVNVKKSVSSNKVNDTSMQASVDQRQNTDDGTWLEGLLQEKDPIASQDTALTDNTDLSELLAKMGMEADHSAPKPHRPAAQADTFRQPLPIASTLWAIGCVILVMLLFAQYLIFNADNIIKNPEKASTLHSICAIASCSLPAADLQQLTMADSMHRPSQVKDAEFFSDIGADIVNQSDNSQLLPSLLIKVYGDNNVLLGDFLAEPEGYLLSPQTQIAASSTLPVLFTIPIEDQQITQVAIQPLY